MSGAAARLTIKALIVRPTSEGLAPSEAPVAARAGKLMSMPEYGTAARKPSSSVKAKEIGCICMVRRFEMSSDASQGGGEPLPLLQRVTIRSLLGGGATALTGRHRGGPPRGFFDWQRPG